MENFDELLQTLAQNLKEARARMAQTQEEAAESIGVDYRYYQRIEQGVQPISLRTLHRLAEYFQVETTSLLRKK